jgi:hypothetical protein
MSSPKNYPNMTADVAAALIQSVWRSRPKDYQDYEGGCEPVYDENRKIMGYIDRKEMKILCDPTDTQRMLEEGAKDPPMDRLVSERLAHKYLPPTLRKKRATKRCDVPIPLDLAPSRYSHPDNVLCSLTAPSPTCNLCFRYFCSYCDHGVGGMYGKCRATEACCRRSADESSLPFSLFSRDSPIRSTAPKKV